MSCAIVISGAPIGAEVPRSQVDRRARSPRQPTTVGTVDWNRDVAYLGAFRLPPHRDTRSRVSNGGFQLAIRSATNNKRASLFTVGHPHHQLVAEFEIPDQVVASHNWSDLPEARTLQPFGDVTGGLRNSNVQNSGRPMDVWGLCATQVRGETKLLVMINRYYNVAAENYATLVISDPDLAKPNSRGVYSLARFHSELVGGWMTEVPKRFAERHLGGQRILCGKSMTWRAQSSPGPCAFAFNPDDTVGESGFLAHGTRLATSLLLRYESNPRLPRRAFPSWTGGNICEGAVFLETKDSRSALVFFGRQGDVQKRHWYGTPSAFQDEFGIAAQNPGKGYKSAPYKSVCWLYRTSDLLSVMRGGTAAWNVQPYQICELEDQFIPSSLDRVGGAAQDLRTKRLYVLQSHAFRLPHMLEPLPVVHVWQLK